jgi:hypothetical protein
MHPWMLEQVASEHRRDLLARARTAQTRTAQTRTAQTRTASQPSRPRWPWHRTARGSATDRGAPVPLMAPVRSRPRLRVLR